MVLCDGRIFYLLLRKSVCDAATLLVDDVCDGDEVWRVLDDMMRQFQIHNGLKETANVVCVYVRVPLVCTKVGLGIV